MMIGEHSTSRMLTLFCLIFLFVNPVMCKRSWRVRYSNTEKCALKGSTTLLSGSFRYPEDLELTYTFWTINPVKGSDPPDLCKDPQYKDRIEYMKTGQNFVLKLSNVTHEDEKMYCIRILTDEEKFLEFPGTDLKVTELRVEVLEEVIEGNSTVLFCRSSCNFSSSTEYRWYKNNIPLSESFSRSKLFLHVVSSEDAGEYRCALRTHEHLRSPAVFINVARGGSKVLPVTAGIVMALVCICAVIVFIRTVRRKMADSGVIDRPKQENVSMPVTQHTPVHVDDVSRYTASDSKKDLYASIAHHKPSRDQTAGEELQYVSVHHSNNTKNKEEAESQYGNVSNHSPALPSSRSNAGLVEDSSVIYSSIKIT